MADSSDKSLGEVFQMSVRCFCLLVTMVLLVTIVGYIFVAIQATWAKNLGSEVDRLETANELLEKNNERFKASNEKLEEQVDLLREDVEELREQIGNFSEMNLELETEIADLNENKQKLENTTDNIKDQSQQLKVDVDNLSNKTASLEDTVQQLNSTSERLRDELLMFRELESRMGDFANSTADSFNRILQLAREAYDESVKSSLISLKSLLMMMLNNAELAQDGAAGFTRQEYIEWIKRVSYVLPQTQQQLLKEYPYGQNTKTDADLMDITEQIVQKQRQQLQNVSSGKVLGWFMGLQEEYDGGPLDLIQAMSRKMLTVI